MTKNHSLREQIDACRHHPGDLALPELTDLALAAKRDKAVADELARSQRLDAAIAEGLNDLPVPPSLADRLLAAVHAAEGKQSAASRATLATAVHVATTTIDASPAVPVSVPPPSFKKLARAVFASRRSWYIAACASAVLVVAALAGHYWSASQHIIEQEQIASALGGWQKALATNRAGGLPRDFVLPPLAVKPVRYVPFQTAEGWSAVAVDCTPPSGRPATLFIVRSSARFRVPTAPYTRLAAMPGKTVAAWKSGRLLYVLVVEETSNQRLEDFVGRQSFTRAASRRSAVRST